MKKILVIVSIMSIISMVGVKANRTRECRIAWVDSDVIAVVHPNGRIYKYELDQMELNNYSKNEKIKVVFNELYDWETQYTIKKIK